MKRFSIMKGMWSARETFPQLTCNAGGADISASVYEEKVTCAKLLSFGSAATLQQKFLQTSLKFFWFIDTLPSLL